jgi:hypothetical protein
MQNSPRLTGAVLCLCLFIFTKRVIWCISFCNYAEELKTKMKRIAWIISALSLLLAQVAVAAEARQCDGNATLYCGAYTASELQYKVAHGDGKNSAASLQKIFLQENRGITNEELAKAADGELAKDGTVTVAQKVVATVATVSGRDKVAGSTPDGSLFARPASAAIGNSPAPALVYSSGGKFEWAVLKHNGNIVKANAADGGAAAATPQPAGGQPATGGSGETMPTSGPGDVALGLLGASAVLWLVYLNRRSQRQIVRAMRTRG